MNNTINQAIPGKIILSEYRSLHEFMNGQYHFFPQIKTVLFDQNLDDIWDVYLEPYGEINIHSSSSDIMIIPIYNDIKLTFNETDTFLYPGSYYLIPSKSNSYIVKILNQNIDIASCLILQIKNLISECSNTVLELPLTINSTKNKLVTIDKQISIGSFDCKKKEIKNTIIQSKHLYFVIEGSFEIDDRLLGPRDTLILWDKEIIEIESLSNNSILLEWKSV